LTFRLLALDIDGTLLRSDRTISPRTRAAIAAARARGVDVALVTGRRYPSARLVAEDLGGRAPLVLHNGALVVEEGTVVRCRPLAKEIANRAILAGRSAGADPVVHCGLGGEGRLLVEGLSPSNTLLAYYLDKSHPDVAIVADLVAALGEDPLQVMYGGTIAEMDALQPPLTDALGTAARIERTVYPRIGVGLLDILQPGVGKAEALEFLQTRFGVAAAETLAIGDNWNDHEMLEHSGLGLVMGNADPALREMGLPVLPSNDEDGVAVAIERHILGS
jgi:hydroxymethylpyrimidine pyrophosphatase-like HAD family hydrolase